MTRFHELADQWERQAQQLDESSNDLTIPVVLRHVYYARAGTLRQAARELRALLGDPTGATSAVSGRVGGRVYEAEVDALVVQQRGGGR